MVQIRELINTSILNSEWVGFNGDSEYIDEDGEIQMGCWTFKDILQDPQGTPYQLTDEVDNYAIYGDCTISVINENGNVCLVELGYTNAECEKCAKMQKRINFHKMTEKIIIFAIGKTNHP